MKTIKELEAIEKISHLNLGYKMALKDVIKLIDKLGKDRIFPTAFIKELKSKIEGK